MKELTLELKNGNKVEQSWVLEKNKTFILGRSADVDIVLDEKTASRKHAQIKVLAGGSASIQDLDSANGTFVDGKQVNSNQMVILRKGAQIILGEMKKMLVVKEKIVESEDEEEETPKAVVNKKNAQTKPQKKVESEDEDEEEEEEIARKIKHKDRLEKSKEPKILKGEKSRSRSRSAEKETQNKSEQFKAYTGKATIKLPKKVLAQQEAQKGNADKAYKDIGLGEDSVKFMKLMGVKNVENAKIDDVKLLPGLKYLKGDMKEFQSKNEQMNQDLEYQFDTGVNRRFAGKRGLGAW